MSKAIVKQFLSEENSKMSSLREVSGKVIQFPVGTRVLVYFPVTKESKLRSNWKGVYLINEQIDENTFIVHEKGQSRKKYIVDRARLRKLGPEIVTKLIEPEPTQLLQQSSAELGGRDTNTTGLREPESNELTTDEFIVGDEEQKRNINSAEAEIEVAQPSKEEDTPIGRPKRAAKNKAQEKMARWIKDLR